MKPRIPQLHRRPHAITPTRSLTKAQEADFTAEGAPPPGKVALEGPALPEAVDAPPAGAAEDKG